MLFIKLVQYVLRTFDRACHQLGIKHHIQCINPKMPFRFLIPAIDLDRIAHCLKSMKRQSDRKQYSQVRDMTGKTEMTEYRRNIGNKEIIVFKDRQYADVGNQ